MPANAPPASAKGRAVLPRTGRRGPARGPLRALAHAPACPAPPRKSAPFRAPARERRPVANRPLHLSYIRAAVPHPGIPAGRHLLPAAPPRRPPSALRRPPTLPAPRARPLPPRYPRLAICSPPPPAPDPAPAPRLMWRKLRSRSRARRATKAASSSTPTSPLSPTRAGTVARPGPADLPQRDAESSPLITRSPSLPHPSPAAPDLHTTRARTDVGTRADTSVPGPPVAAHHHLHHLHHSHHVSTQQHPVHVPAVHPSPEAPAPVVSVPSSGPTQVPFPTGLPHEPHRNRRLSLDGDLPPSAIRPDDDDALHDETMAEGLFEVFPDAFRPSIIDVAACSKAGWEPVRGHLASVPPMHTVEVRKENQDAYCAFAPFRANPTHPHPVPDPSQPSTDLQIFLGVFDGHGAQGRPIAQYARDYIATVTRDASVRLATDCNAPSVHQQQLTSDRDISRAIIPPELHRARLDTLKAAFSRAERALTESDSGIDHVFSGTTAVVAWMFGRDLYTAWTGDSRCVIGRSLAPENGRIRFRAIDLSHDQKPVRADEKRRVRSAGGRIARWQRNMGPLRVWLPRDWTPGLAMTRSIGDTVLSEYGVSPVPEVTFTSVGPSDSFIVLASDGVWEFMTSQEVVDFIGRMRREGRSASDASEALVREAVRRWRRNEVVVDDTTAVVMWMSWENGEGADEGNTDTASDAGKSKGETLLGKPRKVFSKTRAKVSLKPASLGVQLVGEDGHLSDFVCKNDLFQGI